MKFKRIVESEQKYNNGDKVTFYGQPCTVVAVGLTGGKLTSVTVKDDTAGWTNNVLVNDPNPITAKNFSHLKKIEGDTEMVKEDKERYEDTEPKIYVSTYKKYNNGSLKGEWVTLTDFDNYEDFVDYCKELHDDESDPEFMVQDFEYFPKAWYHESGLPDEETFYKIIELAELDENEREAYEAYVSLKGDEVTVEDFREAYRGRYSSPTDFAESLVEDMGFETAVGENVEWYFDYEAFGRDLRFDLHEGDENETDAEGEPEDPEWLYDSGNEKFCEYTSDDTELAEHYIDDLLGDIKELGKDTIERYFDYEKFGRDLMMGDFEEENGYYFWAN